MFCYLEYKNEKYYLNHDEIINQSLLFDDCNLTDEEMKLIPNSTDALKSAIRSKLTEISDKLNELSESNTNAFHCECINGKPVITIKDYELVSPQKVQVETKLCMDDQMGEFLAKTIEMHNYKLNGHYELAVLQNYLIELPVGIPIGNEKQLFIPPSFFGLPVLIKNDNIHYHSSNNGFMQVRDQYVK